MWLGGGLGSIVMMLFWGLVIVALVLWIKQLVKTSTRSDMVSALSIAAERYARGEIGKEEFESIKSNLK